MTPPKDLPPELVDQLKFIIENSDRFDRPQSFPFFPDDWLGSPGILTAHPAVEGGYIHLLAIEWGEVDLWLPCDDESLATSSRLNSEWPKYADRVLRFFYKHPFREGLVNHKLIEVRAKQLSYASRGQAGGLAKGLAEGKQKAKLEATPHPHPHPHPGIPKPVLVRNCADESNSSAPPAENQPAAKARSFRERLVDGCLIAFGKRYAKTRGQEYPGGLPALRESGFGVVTKRLKTLCPEVPYRKTAEVGMTPEQIESLCKAALAVWGGYLDRAALIHEAAKGIPGKDGDWLRFPDTVAKFCGRISKLTDADVDAARKRAADVSEAKRNQKRMNPGSEPAIRYGQMEKVIP